VRSRSIFALVFGSSAAILILEILAGRLLAPFLGVSLETFTGIIGTVLAAIALGNTVGGRLADRQVPQMLLGPILIAAGASTWFAPFIVSAIGPGVPPGPISIVFLSALAFFVPAALLSTISPLAAKMQLQDLSQTGAVVGSLSAWGTAGALFGTFITGFVLVAALPTRPIIWTVGAVLVVVGVLLWVRFARWEPKLGVGVLLLAGLGWIGTTISPCDAETAYACVDIVEDPDRPGGRSLYLDGLRNSYVDLNDPTYLEFRYMQLIEDVLVDFEPQGPGGPIDTLTLGGAAFSIPRWIEATRPGSQNLALEIDKKVLEISQEELGLVLTDSMQALVGDARLTIRDVEPESYDLVFGDLFAGLTLPWHLTTVEFLTDVKATMRPGGLMIANVVDGGEGNFIKAELASWAELFDHIAMIGPPGGFSDVGRNVILLGSDNPIATPTVDPEDGEWFDEAATREFVGDTKPLTDDFAPVDQIRVGH